MSELLEACTEYLSVFNRLAKPFDATVWYEGLCQINEAARRLGVLSHGSTNEERWMAAQALLPTLNAIDSQASAETAITLGIFIEHGLNPATVGLELIEAFGEVIHQLMQFVEIIETEIPKVDDEVEENSEYWVGNHSISQEKARELWQRIPYLVQAHAGIHKWQVACVAALSRDRTLLALARQKNKLIEDCNILRYHGVIFVNMLLQMPMDELFLVIHPTTRQGFWIKVDNVTDNYQLHILLANALVKEKKDSSILGPTWGIEGTRPNPAIVNALLRHEVQSHPSSEGVWDLCPWTSIESTGTISRKSHLGNDSIPADIQKFEGIRVLILGPQTIQRSWNTAKSIPQLSPSLNVEKILSLEEVDHWLERLSSSNSRR